MEHEIFDGAWKLFDHDPVTGRCVWVTYQDDKTIYRVDMPLDKIFAANNEAAQETNGRRFGDWNRIASVPSHLAYQNGLDDAIEQHDDKFVAKFMNDIDNRKFRTSRGRV